MAFVQHSPRLTRFTQLAAISYKISVHLADKDFSHTFYKAQILQEISAVQSKGQGEQEKEAVKPSVHSLVVLLLDTSCQASQRQQKRCSGTRLASSICQTDYFSKPVPFKQHKANTVQSIRFSVVKVLDLTRSQINLVISYINKETSSIFVAFGL